MKKLHLIICVCGLTCVWLYAGVGRAQRNADRSISAAVGKDKSAVVQQASKHSVIRSSKPTKQSVTETVDSAAKTNKSLKRIKRNKMNQGQLRRSALKFAEVEVVLDDQFDIEYISSLPRAPRSDLEVFKGGRRVRVQLPWSTVTDITKGGVKVKILRKFVLIEGSSAPQVATSQVKAATVICSGTYSQGTNSSDVTIPDDGSGWVYSAIWISSAPSGSVVSCVDVHFEIIHDYVSDLVVDLTNQSGTKEYNLWDREGGSGTSINKTVTGISTFNGETVNQGWGLWAIDEFPFTDSGYIDYWWIKVYYEDEGYTYYIQADSYFKNTVELWFGFASDPGAVCFSTSPECGSLDPEWDNPTYDPISGYWWVSTNYNPCEDECSSVTITADPTYGSNQTKKVHLDDRQHIGCCFPQEMCLLTYDVETGEPDQAWVNVTVVPEEAGTAVPNSGWSQYNSSSGVWEFCSTYTPTCSYTGRGRVKFSIDNPEPYKDSIVIYSFDQEPIIAPSSDWQTVPDSFCTEGFDFNYYQIYKMYLCANASYDFSLCDNDGVGAWCDGDGDLEMFDSSCVSQWYIDGVSSCGYDASTLGTNYEGWPPPSDGYYYLMVSDYSFDQMSYSLAYRGGTLGDFDCSSRVDFADFAILGNQWLQAPGSPPADIAPEVPDNFVNILDIAVFAENWLEGAAP